MGFVPGSTRRSTSDLALEDKKDATDLNFDAQTCKAFAPPAGERTPQSAPNHCPSDSAQGKGRVLCSPWEAQDAQSQP